MINLLQEQPIVFGVTSCDPSDLTTLPEGPQRIPQSRVITGGYLRKNSHIVRSCPKLLVSPGDDVSIKHTEKQIHFYKNKQLHYTWNIETPAPVWGYVALDYVNKISVKGQTFYHFIFVILTSYDCKCK